MQRPATPALVGADPIARLDDIASISAPNPISPATGAGLRPIFAAEYARVVAKMEPLHGGDITPPAKHLPAHAASPLRGREEATVALGCRENP